MILSTNFAPNKIIEDTDIKDDKSGFPYMFVGRKSYAAGIYVQSGYDFHPEDGCHNIQIGRYCAFAEDIRFMVDQNHDFNSPSIGSFSELEVPGQKHVSKTRIKGSIMIGNDVWIGHGATIMPGVVIHDGAVIGTNALVTKDVPAYAIVGGNPAKVIRYRFSPEVIKRMKEIAWWNWEPEKIRSKADEFHSDDGIEGFLSCNTVENYYDIGDDSNPVAQLTDGKKYLFCADVNTDFPILPHVIDEFCRTFNSNNAQLVIYIPYSTTELSNAVFDLLKPYQDYDCCVQIIDDPGIDVRNVIRNCDCYITGRHRNNITLISVADYYGIDIISGCDIPIWEYGLTMPTAMTKKIQKEYTDLSDLWSTVYFTGKSDGDIILYDTADSTYEQLFAQAEKVGFKPMLIGNAESEKDLIRLLPQNKLSVLYLESVPRFNEDEWRLLEEQVSENGWLIIRVHTYDIQYIPADILYGGVFKRIVENEKDNSSWFVKMNINKGK